MSKVLERIVVTRMKHTARFSCRQFAFIGGRRAHDSIALLADSNARAVQHVTYKRSGRGDGRPGHVDRPVSARRGIMFYDMSQAYDRVDIDRLLAKLTLAGVESD